MKLLQSNVFGGKKLNCCKATQVLGGPTQTFIWGSKIAKGFTRSIMGDLELWYQGGPKILGGEAMNPNDAMGKFSPV